MVSTFFSRTVCSYCSGTDYEGGRFSRYLFCYSPIPAHYVDPLVPHLIQEAEKKGLNPSFCLLGSAYVWPQGIHTAFKKKEITNILISFLCSPDCRNARLCCFRDYVTFWRG